MGKKKCFVKKSEAVIPFWWITFSGFVCSFIFTTIGLVSIIDGVNKPIEVLIPSVTFVVFSFIVDVVVYFVTRYVYYEEE